MNKQKIYEILVVFASIISVSTVTERLIAGSMYVSIICGLLIYILILHKVEQFFFRDHLPQKLESANPKTLNIVEYDKVISIFSQIFECGSIATVLVNPKFEILWHNMLFSQVLERNKIAPEASIMNFLTEESQKIIKDMYLNNKNVLIIPPFELEISELQKTILVYISKLSQIHNDNMLINIIDITDYKVLENNYAHSQKMQALGQLSGAIAHDFNNLLTAIIGFSDLLLLKHIPGDSSFPELMQIKQNANRAANLVKQLLAFSRKQVMKPSIISVTDAIEDLSHLLVRLIGLQIKLTIEHGSHLKSVKVDQSQLDQVLINLVVNARDAIEENGEISIKTSNIIIDKNFNESDFYVPFSSTKITEGAYVMIVISDNGSGIDKKIINKIFEPFFSTKDASSGTGLGLATVFGIVSQLDGFIRLKTKKMEGTSFYIFFKASDIQADQPKIDPYETANDSLTDLRSYKVTNGTVMIVEDEAPIRLFSSHVLLSKGYDILQAENGEEAWEMLKEKEGNVDLIITDVSLGGMSGIDLIEKVKKRYPHIKVIFTSGYAQDSVSYLSNEDCIFLSKPFSIKELLEHVTSAVSNNNNTSLQNQKISENELV